MGRFGLMVLMFVVGFILLTLAVWNDHQERQAEIAKAEAEAAAGIIQEHSPSFLIKPCKKLHKTEQIDGQICYTEPSDEEICLWIYYKGSPEAIDEGGRIFFTPNSFDLSGDGTSSVQSWSQD